MDGDGPKPATSSEGEDLGFPDISSDLLGRLELLRGDDPEIDLTSPTQDGEEQAAEGARDGKRYIRGPELGRGGMGVVYRVYDTDLRRNLAMKVLRIGVGSTTGSATSMGSLLVRRFLEEAQVTSQLDHPSIVPLHELGVDGDGRIYFTMRVVRGKDFQSIVQEMSEGESDWDIDRVVSAMLKVCDAMGFAHAKNVLHRDIKSSNIMAGKFGEVYVMDWGLAKVMGREDDRDLRPDLDASQAFTAIHTELSDPADGDVYVTMDGTVCGTPAFMPPEQALGLVAQLDARSDVYSLGAVLYHVLTGHPPYGEGGGRIPGHTVLRWVLDGPPKPVLELAPDSPPEVAAICEKAMQREPENRYQSMEELQADLSRYLRGMPVEALRLGWFGRASRWCRSNVLALGLVAAVVVAAGSGVFLMNHLTTALVRQTVKDSAERQAEILEEVNALYTSEVVAPLRGVIDATHDYVGRDDAIPAPATFLTTLAEAITGSAMRVSVRHYSDYPFAFREGGGPRDEFERLALARLRKDPEAPIFEFEEVEGIPYVRYATPRILRQDCVDCHNTHSESTKRDWKVGEVRGALAVHQPLGEEFLATQTRLRQTFLLIGSLVLGLPALVGLVLYRMSRRRESADGSAPE